MFQLIRRMRSRSDSPQSANVDCALILDTCLEDIRAGRATVPDCLAMYPECADELIPLLQLAMTLESVADVHPATEFRRSTRRRLSNLSGPRTSEFGYRASYRTRILILLARLGLTVLTLFGLSSLPSASESSLPGNPLYSVKRGLEKVQLAFAADGDSRVRLHISLANRRLAEAETLAGTGDLNLAEQAAGEYGQEILLSISSFPPTSDHTPSLVQLLRVELTRNRDELRERIAGAPGSSKQPFQYALMVSEQAMAQLGAMAPQPAR